MSQACTAASSAQAAAASDAGRLGTGGNGVGTTSAATAAHAASAAVSAGSISGSTGPSRWAGGSNGLYDGYGLDATVAAHPCWSPAAWNSTWVTVHSAQGVGSVSRPAGTPAAARRSNS